MSAAAGSIGFGELMASVIPEIARARSTWFVKEVEALVRIER
jgi:hypothetical protein